MYSLHCMFKWLFVICSVYSVYSVQCNIPCTVYSVPVTMFNVQFTMHCVPCTVYRLECTVYSVEHTVIKYKVPNINLGGAVLFVLSHVKKYPFGSKFDTWLHHGWNSSKWLQIAPNGFKWPQMAPNGTKWLPIYLKRSK